jgi:16S rRNA (guanine527-N7)-methyltransferase
MRPDDLLAALQRGATELGCSLSDAQAQALLRYLDLLVRWNAVYNLTAVRDPAQILTHHLLDCLAVVEPLRRRLRDRPARLLDVGSGAGLPGIVLAAAVSAIDVTCIDAVAKKASFMRQAAGELQLPNLEVRHGRVEALDAGPFDMVASRAFASLNDLVRMTRRCLAPGGMWLAMKGKVPAEEIAGLPADVRMFHVEPLTVPGLSAERCLVWIRPDPGVI